MNFSELFRQTSQLCKFSPDGKYLVRFTSVYEKACLQMNVSQSRTLNQLMEFIFSISYLSYYNNT